MKIDINNPAHAKLMLLSQGVNFSNDILIDVGNKFSENRYYYNTSNDPQQFTNLLPSEILLPKNVESSIYFNKASLLSIRHSNNKFALFYKDDLIFPIRFNPRPRFFDKTISNQIQCKQILSMYGRYILAIFFNSYCHFFDKNLGCKFCSLKYSRMNLGKDNLSIITLKQFSEAIKIAFQNENRIKYMMYTAGTHVDEDISYKEQINILKIAKRIVPKTIQHHSTMMPTLNDTLMEKVKKAGLDSIAFDIEVFDKNIFSVLCPGKQQYFGYDNFLESFRLAKKIFGKNNIKTGFVGGLEPLASLAEGMDYFGRQGISIAVNVFHPDPNTSLANHPRPTIDYLIKMACLQKNIYEKYKLIPVFPTGGRRSSLDTEIYRGFFN